MIKCGEQILKLFIDCVRKAAGMFESVGKLESAASCYCDLEEYKRAGKVFLIINACL